jgi:MarC family membrane protein
MEWSFFRNFGITLFALLNPLGMLPIFISYTARNPREVQRLVALFVSLTVLGLLLIFMFIGTPMLKFFGVTLDSFRIAGGVLLLIIGINIVNGSGSETKELSINRQGGGSLSEAKSVYRQIVIPMAMPLLVGPGVIANVILYASEVESRLGSGVGIELILMTILVSFLVFLVLAAGQWLQRLLGDIGLSITQRVMGLFVAAIGVQFMVTGFIGIFVAQILPKLQ